MLVYGHSVLPSAKGELSLEPQEELGLVDQNTTNPIKAKSKEAYSIIIRMLRVIKLVREFVDAGTAKASSLLEQRLPLVGDIRLRIQDRALQELRVAGLMSLGRHVLLRTWTSGTQKQDSSQNQLQEQNLQALPRYWSLSLRVEVSSKTNLDVNIST